MNITLIATHQFSFSEKVPLYKSLGVLTLASCLRSRSLKCSLTISNLSDFHHIGRYGFVEAMESAARLILNTSPDLIGFSTMTTNLPFALELCRIAKQKNRSVKTLLGGPGASFCADEILTEFPDVDYIIRGEADRAFPDFIELLIKKEDFSTLKGLVCRKQEGLTDNHWPDPIADPDRIPVPAFDLCESLDTTNEQSGYYNGVCLEVGRGCPYNCTFCSTSHFFKRRYRTKSVARVVAEIEEIKKRTGTKRIIFNHDLLTFQREYVEELCSGIEKKFPDLEWKCHSRIDKVDRELLVRMKKAGCNEMFFGIECATQRMQKKIRKNLKLEKLEEITPILTELGFIFSLSFIIGFPEENIDDLAAVLKTAIKAKYLNRKNVIVNIHMLVPLAGSDLHTNCKEKLVFGTYGSLGTTDIPEHWNEFRRKIEPFPEIFSPYFFINIGRRHREIAIKLEMIGLCVQTRLAYSILVAYELIGDSLAEKIVEYIDRIELPPPDTFNNIRFDVLEDSLCGLILSFLVDKPNYATLFETISQFEKALYKVKNNKETVIVIEVCHDPMNIIKHFDAGVSLTKIPESKAKRFFMIKRDEQDGKIKSTEINENIKNFIHN